MKKIIPLLVVVSILVSCKKDIVKTPDHLIEKNKMINIIYDLSILESVKTTNPTSLDSFKINPTEYIYKKHKIDSVQFAQNNIYYASDYKAYKAMFEQIKSRLEKNKSLMDTLIKIESKKITSQKNKEGKLKAEKKAKTKIKTNKGSDSIKKLKKGTILKKETDLTKRITNIKAVDSIKKSKKKKKFL